MSEVLEPVVTPVVDPVPPVVPPVEPTPPKVEPKTVTKDLYDKTATELAAAKRLLKEKMTDDELKSAKDTELQEELNTLRQEKSITKLALDLAKNGVEDSEKIAEQFVKGETGEAVKGLLKAKDKIISDLTKEVDTLKLQKMGDPAVREPNDSAKTISELMQEANLHPERTDQILAQIDELNKMKK